MKNQINFKSAVAAVIFAAVFQLGIPAHAGLIDLLRGAPEPEAPVQRVAFVGAAVVKEVRGQAERLAGIDRWIPLKAGAMLNPGDVVRTGQGTVVLRMKESGSFIKVTPNTQLRLTLLENGWDRAALSGREERTGFSVRACRGPAHRRDAGGQWRPLAVNEVVPAGTVVRIEDGTVLDLFWTSEQRHLRLEGKWEATLDASVFPSRESALAVVSR